MATPARPRHRMLKRVVDRWEHLVHQAKMDADLKAAEEPRGPGCEDASSTSVLQDLPIISRRVLYNWEKLVYRVKMNADLKDAEEQRDSGAEDAEEQRGSGAEDASSTSVPQVNIEAISLTADEFRNRHPDAGQDSSTSIFFPPYAHYAGQDSSTSVFFRQDFSPDAGQDSSMSSFMPPAPSEGQDSSTSNFFRQDFSPDAGQDSSTSVFFRQDFSPDAGQDSSMSSFMPPAPSEGQDSSTSNFFRQDFSPDAGQDSSMSNFMPPAPSEGQDLSTSVFFRQDFSPDAGQDSSMSSFMPPAPSEGQYFPTYARYDFPHARQDSSTSIFFSPYAGQDSSMSFFFPHVGQESRGRHDFMMGKLTKYLMRTMICVEVVQSMPSPKFNIEQCGYLLEKLEATLKSAISFTKECHAQQNDEFSNEFSNVDMERWVEIFKLLLVLGKQVENFFQDCGKDAWIQTAMTLAGVGEYVSSIGFDLELCKLAFCKKEGVARSYTLEEVVKLNENEIGYVKVLATYDTWSLLKKASDVLDTLNAQDLELAKYLQLKLGGNVGYPSHAEDSSNAIVKLFKWVKNLGGRVEQIGKGASARVYKVMWFGMPVAKKTFDGPNNIEFLQEVKILSQLHHPNITSMFCCSMNNKECSIIMELMDGSLYEMLRSRRGEDDNFLPFSDLEGLDLMLQVGEGVEYLHCKKIVHRDLKSANILVRRMEAWNTKVEYMQVKVVDFGLSKTKETSTSLSTMTYNVGSSRWMAPEFMKLSEVNQGVCESFEKALKYNFKGDIYSFGMVCYEILAGEIPFQSEGSQRIVKMMVLGGLRPILPKHCIPKLAKLIEKCWNKDPKERPSIGDVCAELKYLKSFLLMNGITQECSTLSMDDI